MKHNYRKLIIGASVILTAFLLTACGGDDDKDASPGKSTDKPGGAWLTRQTTPQAEFVPTEIEGVLDNIVTALNATPAQPAMKLAVVTKDATEFFQIAMLGSNRAVSELGIVGAVQATASFEDVEEYLAAQIALAQSYLDQGYQGLAIAPISGELSDLVNTATAAGLPVVTFDSDLAASNRQFYLGTDNSAAGKTAGETLVSLIGNTVGTVIVYGHFDEGWLDGYNRSMGAVQALEAAGHTVVQQSTAWGEPQTDIDSMTTYIQEADPPVVGMIGMFNNSYLCADVAVASGLGGTIKIAAFDFEAQTLQHLQDGNIQATHVQRQYYMGYLAPYIMYAVNALGIEATKALLAPINVGEGLYDTGLDVITADNIASYNNFLNSLGILN